MRTHADMRRAFQSPFLAATLAVLSACTVGPAYQRPDVATPTTFKEAPPAGDSTWFPAAPADELDRGRWWELFDDPILSSLASQVEVSNQNVAAAVAAYAEAQALVSQQRAALFPGIGLDASATRNGGQGAVASGSNLRLGFSASWEPDIWGQLRLAVTGAQASAQAGAANLAAATLSAQAALATNYFALREADNEIALLTDAVNAYERARQITENQYDAGIAQRTDVLQAQTQLETTRANLSAAVGQRARLEHAIALLVGKAPADFSIAAATWNMRVPGVPLVVPSTLLQRRPDIAAAERAVAAANAQIGIQRAAYFPNIGLTAAYGTAGGSLLSLFRTSGNVWSLGLTVAQTIFDAGAIAAKVEGATAARDVAIANYRQTVLTAFVAVEDQLATIRSLAEQEGARRAASADADRTEQLTLNQFLQGQVPYTSVVLVQVIALNARQTLSQLMSSQQAAAVALIQALGGGWHEPDEAAASAAVR
jgi:NodT family efflux transporter outer membrane factor (OMF) lipoprotein